MNGDSFTNLSLTPLVPVESKHLQIDLRLAVRSSIKMLRYKSDYTGLVVGLGLITAKWAVLAEIGSATNL